MLQKAETKKSGPESNTATQKLKNELEKELQKLQPYTENLNKKQTQKALKIVKNILCQSTDYEF